ncbi:thiaminase II [Agrobacterium rhizogenes]|nr:thiaminase II [Rhizobium rhizogenes]NTG32210.1 thiaminase II [Rhizobium rhizogenes]
MIEIDFSYGLFGKLRHLAGEEWTNYVNHPFVRQLAVGTLPEPCFRRFLTQDYLYLIHCARAHALLAHKGQTLDEIRAATSTLQAILDELPLHAKYCKSWGITEAMIDVEPEAPETMTYTRYVLDIGHSGDILDLMAALLPCVAGYAEISQIMHSDKRTVLEGNIYGDWIKNYEADHYRQSVQSAIATFDAVGKCRGGEARLAHLSKIFATATQLESAFWQMGLNAVTSTIREAAE